MFSFRCRLTWKNDGFDMVLTTCYFWPIFWNLQIPPEKVFLAYFGGPNTFSQLFGSLDYGSVLPKTAMNSICTPIRAFNISIQWPSTDFAAKNWRRLFEMCSWNNLTPHHLRKRAAWKTFSSQSSHLTIHWQHTAKSHDLLAQPDVGRILRKQKNVDQICSRKACFNWGKKWMRMLSNAYW